MSAPRDSLATDEAREKYDQAVSEAGAVLAAARRSRDEAYAHGGAEEVARLAYVPGGPPAGELAAGFERLAGQARERRNAA